MKKIIVIIIGLSLLALGVLIELDKNVEQKVLNAGLWVDLKLDLGLPDRWIVKANEWSGETFIGFGLLAFFCLPSNYSSIICSIAGKRWILDSFCRGWLVLGETGTGKTSSGIRYILHELFKKAGPFGMLVLDAKGNMYQDVEEIATHYDANDRLCLLQVRSPHRPADWKPPFQFNLLSYPNMKPSAYAKLIIDTGASLGQSKSGNSSFFATQAQKHIEEAIKILQSIQKMKNRINEDLLRDLPPDFDEESGFSPLELYKEMPKYPAMHNIYNFLATPDKTDSYCALIEGIVENYLQELGSDLVNSLRISIKHFRENLLNQPEEQQGGVRDTLKNYIGFFLDDDLIEVFCSEESTFDFTDIDKGILFSVSIPQDFQVERKYINTFLKLLYYVHAKRRFDLPEFKKEIKKKNLIICLADEAQNVITAPEGGGLADHEVLGEIREAKATSIFATQDLNTISATGLKDAELETLLANLANRMVFKAASEKTAKNIESKIGFVKKKEIQKSVSSKGGSSRSFSKKREGIITADEITKLKPFECIIIHCKTGHKRVKLPPLTNTGEKVKSKYLKTEET